MKLSTIITALVVSMFSTTLWAVVRFPVLPTTAVFSVSPTQKVTFSPGNLQYQPSTKTWRFAPEQTSMIGESNTNISATYTGWVDLFGWSTDNPLTPSGVSNSKNTSDYHGSFVDWGGNQIENFAPNTWRTLSYDEWNYLIRNRGYNTYSLACVAGVNGLILFPDNWQCPEGITLSYGYGGKVDPITYSLSQTLSDDQWYALEAAGAIFLPANGYRSGVEVDALRLCGCYWSSTPSTRYQNDAYMFSFEPSSVGMSNNVYRHFGRSVRLVRNVD